MKKKAKYRLRNWKEYNQSLRERGSLTFWVSEDLLDNWLTKETTGQRGASAQYTEAAIKVMAQLKFVFKQAGRQTMGLLASLFEQYLRQIRQRKEKSCADECCQFG